MHWRVMLSRSPRDSSGYDQDTRELYIMEGLDSSFMQPAMAHELFHAVQDQVFGIDLLQKGFEEEADDNSDILIARTALMEGDAMAVMFDFTLEGKGTFTDMPMSRQTEASERMSFCLSWLASTPRISSMSIFTKSGRRVAKLFSPA